MRYQNRGARFLRDDGSWWNRGAIHEPTYAELSRWRQKLVAAPELPKIPKEEVEPAPVWHLAMKPEMYLRLHPDGEHASLAREFVKQPEESDGRTDE